MDIIVDALMVVLQPINLFYIAVGVIPGIIVGAIPGLTATLAIALLLPFTFTLDTVPALLMLVGIFVGGLYGGCITAILVNAPGTPGAAAVALDGYPLTQQGFGGKALAVATIGSFVGGIVSATIMIFASPIVADFALRFSSAEYTMLAIFGLTVIFSVSGKSIAKGLISGILGLLVATVGMDVIMPTTRFTFGISKMMIGLPLLPVFIGLFAVAEVFKLVELSMGDNNKVQECHEKPNDKVEQIKNILPSVRELYTLKVTLIKSGILGSLIGALPGAGANMAAFVAYGEAKRASKNPELFGQGSLEGVASAQAGNNAITGGALIPMLSLGIPGDAVTAVLLGALTIQGLSPGPRLFVEHLNVIYPIFIGLFFANIIMVTVGLMGAKYISKLAMLKKTTLVPLILIFSLVGAYAAQASTYHMLITFFFGILGYILVKFEFPVAPIGLAVVLGPIVERSLRTALLRSDGSLLIFVSSPISIILTLLTILTVVFTIIRQIKSVKLEN